MDYKEIIEKLAIAGGGDFRSGSFSNNSANSTSGFSSGSFSNNSANSTSGFSSGSFSTSEKKEESKSEPRNYRVNTDIPKQKREPSRIERPTHPYSTITHLTHEITNNRWFDELPPSLQEDLESEIQDKVMMLVESGTNEKVIPYLISRDVKKAIDDDLIESYKKVDSVYDDIMNSNEYNEAYNKSTARKTGMKYGAGIGTALGVGAMLGSGSVPKALGSAALLGLTGAGIGRLGGTMIDGSRAFNAAASKVAPDFSTMKDDARRKLNRRY